MKGQPLSIKRNLYSTNIENQNNSSNGYYKRKGKIGQRTKKDNQGNPKDINENLSIERHDSYKNTNSKSNCHFLETIAGDVEI